MLLGLEILSLVHACGVFDLIMLLFAETQAHFFFFVIYCERTKLNNFWYLEKLFHINFAPKWPGYSIHNAHVSNIALYSSVYFWRFILWQLEVQIPSAVTQLLLYSATYMLLLNVLKSSVFLLF